MYSLESRVAACIGAAYAEKPTYELQSELLKGGHVGDDIGENFRGY